VLVCVCVRLYVFVCARRACVYFSVRVLKTQTHSHRHRYTFRLRGFYLYLCVCILALCVYFFVCLNVHVCVFVRVGAWVQGCVDKVVCLPLFDPVTHSFLGAVYLHVCVFACCVCVCAFCVCVGVCVCVCVLYMYVLLASVSVACVKEGFACFFWRVCAGVRVSLKMCGCVSVRVFWLYSLCVCVCLSRVH